MTKQFHVHKKGQKTSKVSELSLISLLQNEKEIKINNKQFKSANEKEMYSKSMKLLQKRQRQNRTAHLDLIINCSYNNSN